jgi:hypothetical protein
MAASLLDTHAMVKRLVGTGMPEPQAEAVTELLKESHEAALERFVTRETLRYELALVEERLNKRIDALDKDLTIRPGGMLAAAVVIVGALVAIL